QRRAKIRSVRRDAGLISGQRRREKAAAKWAKVERLYRALEQDDQCPPRERSSRIAELLNMPPRTVQHILKRIQVGATNKSIPCSLPSNLKSSSHEEEQEHSTTYNKTGAGRRYTRGVSGDRSRPTSPGTHRHTGGAELLVVGREAGEISAAGKAWPADY